MNDHLWFCRVKQFQSGSYKSHRRPKTKHHRLVITEMPLQEVTSAATVIQEGVRADVTVVTAAEAPVDVSVGTEGSVGRAGTGLVIFMGMKRLEAPCSLRYSPPFSSQSCLLIQPSAAAPLPVGRCSKAQSRAPYQVSRAGREASVTWERVSQEFKCI